MKLIETWTRLNYFKNVHLIKCQAGFDRRYRDITFTLIKA